MPVMEEMGWILEQLTMGNWMMISRPKGTDLPSGGLYSLPSLVLISILLPFLQKSIACYFTQISNKSYKSLGIYLLIFESE